MGEDTEKWVFLLREKQGRDAHPERKGVSILLVRSAVKRQLSHLRRSVFPDLCLQVGNYPHFFFHIWPTLGPSSECTCLLSEGGSWSEDFCEEQDSLWSGVIPWLLTPKEPFCTCVASPLSPKWGKCRSLNPLPKQGFASVLALNVTLTIALSITLRCLQETKTGYYPVSVVTSISEAEQKADCKCFN